MCCAGCRSPAAVPRGEDPTGEFPRPCRTLKLREKIAPACEAGVIIALQVNVLPIRSDTALTLWQGGLMLPRTPVERPAPVGVAAKTRFIRENTNYVIDNCSCLC